MVWNAEEDKESEENAVAVALRRGSEKLRTVLVDFHATTPGDRPASLWRFRDGSELIIGDDGGWVLAPKRGYGGWQKQYTELPELIGGLEE